MSFSFVQITDHHLLDSEAALRRGYSPSHAFRSVLRHIATQHADVDFIVTTGDIIDDGSDTEYLLLRRILGLEAHSAAPGPQSATTEGLVGMPMYFMPGNHDPREPFFRTMFPTARTDAGTPPTAMNVSFLHKGVQFVCIDWGTQNYAVTSPAMLEHLERSLANDMPSIILSHHNVTPVGMPRLDGMVARDIDRFADIIRGRNVIAILAGHAHTTYDSSIAAIPVHGLRSTHFSFAQIGDEFCYVLRPPQYRVVTVTGSTLTSVVVDVPL